MGNLVEDWEHIAPEGLAVHIRYKDPVSKRCNSVLTRETLGWLTHKVGDCFCIEHDRTVENIQYLGGSGNGLILQKSCILEIRVIYETDKRERTGRPILKRFLNYFLKKKSKTKNDFKSKFSGSTNPKQLQLIKTEKVLRGEKAWTKN